MLREFSARVRMIAAAFVAAAVSLAPLGACGVKGPLKPPPASAAAGASTPGAQPAASTESPAASPPKTPETQP